MNINNINNFRKKIEKCFVKIIKLAEFIANEYLNMLNIYIRYSE